MGDGEGAPAGAAVSLPVLLRPQVEGEIQDAADWYDAQRAGLGDELLICVEAAIARVARSPESCARVHGEVRRALVRRFPYCVYYKVEDEALLVLAVGHERRKPGYWANRA